MSCYNDYKISLVRRRQGVNCYHDQRWVGQNVELICTMILMGVLPYCNTMMVGGRKV